MPRPSKHRDQKRQTDKTLAGLDLIAVVIIVLIIAGALGAFKG